MADDKTKTGSPDSRRINIHEDYEVKYWSSTLGVSAQELIDAVQKVGTIASDVEAHLKKK